MAQEMAFSVNVGINDSEGILNFERDAPELRECTKDDFFFTFRPVDGGKQIAVFEIHKNGAVVRRNESKPFRAGAIIVKSQKVNKDSCIVTVKKDADINLNDIFE